MTTFHTEIFLLYTVGLFRFRGKPRVATRVHITYRADGWVDLRYWQPSLGKVLSAQSAVQP